MVKETFAVGCQGIAYHNGVVVIDLNGLSLGEKDEQGRPKKELKHRVIMTADGAVETFDALKNMLDKLVEVGILTRKPGQAGQPGQGGEEVRAKPAQGGEPKSPNFQS